jgi:hypothetical protein
MAGIAAIASLLAGAAFADQMTVTRAVQAASLHEGPLDMVAYYVEIPGGLEVTATFAPRAPSAAAPVRIVMALGDGDDVAFGVPGYPEALYRFTRAGAAVTMSVREAETGLPRLSAR